MPFMREWLQRLVGTIRRSRTDCDLAEELELHMQLAREEEERRGHSRVDARRAARLHWGGAWQALEALRDQRGVPWIGDLWSDIVFGWRQLNKHRTSSAAAILSLGLAIGATTAAFRLIDAALLRMLPVSNPDRLFYLSFTATDSQNRAEERDDFDYPTYQRYARATGRRAELMVVGATAPLDIVVGTGDEPERVFRQYVSGNVFPVFGLQPAAGRLLVIGDDDKPGAHAVAVLSYDYWNRRFGREPNAIGQTLRIGRQTYQIVGVAPKGFTGTEPGRLTDLFIPATMNVQALNSPGWSWFRLWVRPNGGVTTSEIQQTLQTVFAEEHRQQLKSFPPETTRQRIDAYLNERISLLPARSGASGMQKDFRRPLLILAALVALVLLVACTNVANLLIAQALARGREMALRVSIGADRWRLIRLVLVESAVLAVAATIVGLLFASWAVPLVVSMLSPTEDPVRLVLDADWRALAFALALATSVTCLFGLAPALRASSFTPSSALKGESDPRGHRRLMKTLVGAQMAFCVFVLFVAALFGATFARLWRQPLGFAHDRLLLVDAEWRSKDQSSATWIQMVDRMRESPGVESAAFSGWTFLSENRWTGMIFVPGRPLETRPTYFLEIAPGFFETMRIAVRQGRDFGPGDVAPTVKEHDQVVPGVVIVNAAFARVYFDGQNPVGRSAMIRPRTLVQVPIEIVGLVADTVYANVREPMRPIVYVPAGARNNGTFSIRTSGDPVVLASTMRRLVSSVQAESRVRIMPMTSLVTRQMIRERLLATLTMFFAVVALLLACIGLYGVLSYGVVQQRREIGVRMALGARATQVATRVTRDMALIVGCGALIGLAGGFGFGRAIERLLFEVKAVDPFPLLMPLVALGVAALLAAVPPVLRAVRIDPAQILRSE
jgi:putative ABC transport system permease protein